MSEYCLHSPPVYRRFLAGGPELLRLSLPAAAVVVGSGLILLGISSVISLTRGTDLTTGWASATAAVFGAMLVAALAARWLGSRLGALAGLAQLTSTHVLIPHPGSAAELFLCTTVSVAFGAFALANVPGRLPLVDSRWTSSVFYAAAGVSLILAGPVGPVFILTGCLMFLLLSADNRGVRFFASPVGIALFLAMVAIHLAQPERLSAGASALQTSVPGWLVVAGLPWAPLAVLAVVVGVRQGHYATPIWRFLGCWAVVPLLLAAAGSCDRAQLGLLLPPLAVAAAAGLWGLLVWGRRRRRRLRRRVPLLACPAVLRVVSVISRVKELWWQAVDRGQL